MFFSGLHKVIVLITIFVFVLTAGRYCEWTHKNIDRSATSETFEDYTKTLELECERGEPAVLNWTVAEETPDLLYYQVPYLLTNIRPFLAIGDCSSFCCGHFTDSLLNMILFSIFSATLTTTWVTKSTS